MAAGFFIASTLGSGSAYFGPVLASMVLMAVGLGLVTAPSTGAILAVLPLAKAGVGSAVNDVTRELGGTFGVAVTGGRPPGRGAGAAERPCSDHRRSQPCLRRRPQPRLAGLRWCRRTRSRLCLPRPAPPASRPPAEPAN
jgi:hypothetical protein